MTLLEAARDLFLLDEDGVICAAKPFTQLSQAIVVPVPISGKISEIEKQGLKYFLEVSLAREFMEGWLANVSNNPTIQEQCARLIRYAEFDA